MSNPDEPAKDGILDKIKKWDTRKKVSVASLAALLVIALIILSTCRITVETSTVSEDVPVVVDGLPTTGSDGDLEFSVASMKRSDAAGDTSNEALTVTPEGEFILLTFTVHNTSTVPKMYSTVPQVIIGENGTRYPSDTTAFLYANPEIVTIQPDETVTVTEAFDVPKETEIRAFEAHEAVMSHGVRLGVPKT